MTTELYRIHRPTSLDQLIGQDEIVDMLETMTESKKIPHCILATGPSGTGKTTCFRILRTMLDCSDLDFKEVNAADSRGIDVMREIRQSIGISPMNGSTRVWLIDECHQLTPQAQESILKMLEDTPAHVYFFLASTDPQKIKKTIITRSTHLKFRALTLGELAALVSAIYKAETKGKLATTIAEKLAELADGSARKVLVMLHQIIGKDMSDEDAVLQTIASVQVERQGIDVCRVLLKHPSWKDMAAILKNVDEEPEQIRRMVLGYMTNVALGGGVIAKRAVEVIIEFEQNFFDSGRAGLVRACYTLCQ